MSDKENKILDEYLEGGSELSRLYAKNKSTDVPEHLDDAILAAAKIEMGTQPKSSFAPFSSSWQIPLSVAALLVLSVGLVVTLYDERGQSYLKEPLSTTDAVVPQVASPRLETESIKIETKDIAPKKEQFEFDDGMGSKNKMPAEAQTVEAFKQETKAADKIKEDRNKGRADLRLEESEDRPIYFDDTHSDVQSLEEGYAPKIEKPSRLNNGSRQNHIEQLEVEVEELNQTRKEISSERDQLKRELESVETKQILLKKKISRERLPSSIQSSPSLINSPDLMDKMESSNAPVNAQSWLDNILQLWNGDRREEAVKQLQEFRQMYPEFPQSEIEEILPVELLQSLLGFK